MHAMLLKSELKLASGWNFEKIIIRQIIEGKNFSRKSPYPERIRSPLLCVKLARNSTKQFINWMIEYYMAIKFKSSYIENEIAKCLQYNFKWKGLIIINTVRFQYVYCVFICTYIWKIHTCTQDKNIMSTGGG